jgi:hypothetical protein
VRTVEGAARPQTVVAGPGEPGHQMLVSPNTVVPPEVAPPKRTKQLVPFWQLPRKAREPLRRKRRDKRC